MLKIIYKVLSDNAILLVIIKILHYASRKELGIYSMDKGRNYSFEWYDKYLLFILFIGNITINVTEYFLSLTAFTLNTITLISGSITIFTLISTTLGLAYLTILYPNKFGNDGLPIYKSFDKNISGMSYLSYSINIIILYIGVGVLTYFYKIFTYNSIVDTYETKIN